MTAQVRLPPTFFDAHVAPGYSDFLGASLEDLSDFDEQQKYWLRNFIVTQATQSFKPIYRELVFNFLRRTHQTFDAYQLLRCGLADYPTKSNDRFYSYFSALSHAEACITFAAQAIEITRAFMARCEGRVEYRHATDEDVELLLSLYRGLKHIPGMLGGSQFHAQDTLFAWFVADGIQTRKKGFLAFSRLTSLLKELGSDAHLLSTWISRNVTQPK